MNSSKSLSGSLEIYEVFRAMRREFDARARAHGFTQGQWRVLSQLDRNQGISQAGLADILDMQPIAVSRVLDRMESNGLVERQPDPQDRRALQLFLTPAARPMLDILRGIGEELRTIAIGELNDKEQEVLVAMLGRMRRRLEESNKQSSDANGARGRTASKRSA